MKKQKFSKRLGYAVNGIRVAAKEPSFRIQIILALGTISLLVVLRPAPIWWAIVFLTIASVLAAEVFNTALELVVDLLHPNEHPMIGRAKDCAAGAVLILSFASIAILAALLWETFRFQ